MSNPNLSPHLKAVNVRHPKTGLPSCQAVLGETAEVYVLGTGQTIHKSYVTGTCHARGAGSHGNQNGTQVRVLGARLNVGGDHASTGYVQTQVATTPGTSSAALSNAGVLFSP